MRTAQMVRATIVDFVQRRFPAGGELEYSGPELALLNGRRRSRARFLPYAHPSDGSTTSTRAL